MIENTDYYSGPYTVIFSPGVIRYQFNVLIIDDNVLENDKSFRLSINVSSLIRGITVGSVDQAIVNILDEDSKFKLNKNTLGVKKCEANQKPQWLYKRPKTLISSKAKKLNILSRILHLNDIQQFTGHFHNYDWLCHLATL